MKKKAGFKEQLKYKFDNIMAKGTGALIGALAVLSVVLIAVGALVVIVGGSFVAPIADGEPQSLTFFEAFWMSLMRTLDAGTMGGDEGWGFRIIMLGITIGGIFIVSTLIGILSSGLESKLDELRKGRSKILEQGHTLILGWSPQIFTIIQELIYANANQKNAVIAVLADKDKVEMEDEIKTRVVMQGHTRILCRSGSPMDIADLEIANPHDTKAIIILPPEEDDPDISIVKSVLAIANNPERRSEPYTIITHLKRQENLDILSMLGKNDNIKAIVTGDLIARFTAQTTQQVGLSVVYTELMGFDGDEIYMTPEPKLVGKTYRDAVMGYEDSCVIGVKKADGTSLLNPPAETVIEKSDSIIAISEDDDTVKLSGKSSVVLQKNAIRREKKAGEDKRDSFLVLGWNQWASTIIRELDNYASPGSVALVIADAAICAEAGVFATELSDLGSALSNIKLTHKDADTTDRAVLESVRADEYDHVIVLSYENLGVAAADSRTLVTLLHLRDIAEHDDTPFSIISEMLDSRNRDLAAVTGVDDFVVSNQLISLIMAQLSENPDLHDIYTDLFDADGNEIYLKPVSDYIDIAHEVNFYTLCESALEKGETAIGYRSAKDAHNPATSYGIITNPDKSAMIRFQEEDRLIVIAED